MRMPNHRALLRLVGGFALVLWTLPAMGQPAILDPPAPAAAESDRASSGPAGAGAALADPPPQAPAGFWRRARLLGDLGGVRTRLEDAGISLGLTETSEVLGNLTGGLHRGAAYDGLTTMSLTLDTGKALQWPGGTFNISALQIHGRNLSADNLGSFQTASGIEAARATRLWELWFQQAVWAGKVDLKVGQQSLDQEFMVSQYASLYLNTAMGWPVLPSIDLYAGGPAYPLSSLGVRLRTQPAGPLTVLGGVFDDNPPGGPFTNDAQLRGAEASGTRFNLNTGALLIGEVQYAANQPALENKSCTRLMCGLPGTYKLGGWYDTAAFPDQRFDAAGLSLADPASSGIGRMHRGNFSLYGMADQMVWRDREGPRAVGVFARVMGAPADRNLLDWSLNAGVNVKALLPGRDDDTIGVGYGWAHVSGRASDLDRDTGRLTGTASPIRTAEHFIEVTYQCQVAPWWIVQPDLQYVFKPGAGLSNPLDPSRRIGNELILGVRTTVTF
jgi:porin